MGDITPMEAALLSATSLLNIAMSHDPSKISSLIYNFNYYQVSTCSIWCKIRRSVESSCSVPSRGSRGPGWECPDSRLTFYHNGNHRWSHCSRMEHGSRYSRQFCNVGSVLPWRTYDILLTKIDCHVRIGGAKGTNLQAANCPAVHSGIDSSCISGSMMFHMTPTGSGYIENMWLWTADHDIDDANMTQTSVYVARGMLIESVNPLWLYGTASEHATFYQYEFYQVSNVSSSAVRLWESCFKLCLIHF